LLAATLALVTATACGGSHVGGNGLFNGSNQTPGNFTFATPSSSAAAAIGSQGAAPPQSARAAATAAPIQRATQRPASTPPPATFQIAIDSDTSAQPGFQPPNANVYQNTVIVFTNRDSVARSVVSDAGDPASFSSGPIAPGASWSYTATTLGTYNYHDGTRPYTVASFSVVPR
jgi:plastocyanin